MMLHSRKNSSAESRDFNHGKNSLNSAKSHFQQARQAVEEERLQDAAIHYQQTLKYDPEHLISLQELGNVLLHLQRWSEAIPYYHKALKLEPNLPQIYHNLGDAFSHLEQWQDAIASYRKAIELQPDYSWSYNNLADILLKLGQWTQAAQNYQIAIQLHPDFALSHHNLGEVYTHLEQWEQAITAYQKAVDFNPNFIWSQFHLGQLLVQHNRWNEAIHPLQKAVELQPSFEWSHYYLAEAWFNLKQWQNAIKAYRQAIEVKPDFALAYGKLADTLVQQEQWSEAIVCYQKATEIDPVLNVSFYRNLELAKARINPHQADSQLVVDKYSLWPYTVPPAFTFPKTLPNGRPWPKISVVTPSYNQGEFIEETILSVIHQNYPNLEYILIDGGSTDDTVTVLKRYRKYFSYVVSKPDNGQSHALNKGFQRATGEIFTWLNSDDRFAPGALYAAALAFDTSGADVVAGVCQLFEGQQQVQHHLTACKPGVMPLADILDVENCWLSGKFFYQPEVLFTRAIWEKAGGGVDESLYYSMDYEMWARFAAAGATICPITHAIAQFRIHPAQKTNTTENYKPELLATRDQLRTRFQDQISAVSHKTESLPKRDHLRVVLFSDLGFSGGAGLAHEQIGRALAAAGHEIMPIAGASAWQPQPIEFSARRAIQLISCLEPDLVILGNLHNIQDSVEVLEEISAKYPTIFVMHDQWLLTGRCAYTGDCDQYKNSCDRSCPTFDHYPALAPEDIQPTFERKRQLLLNTENLLVLGNSQWTTNWARQALQSSLSVEQQDLLDKKIQKITLGIDIDTFKPRDKNSCRQRLGLPEDKFIILTGHTSLQDERKGGQYLIEALKLINLDDILVVSFGYGESQIEGLNYEIQQTGFIQNRSILAYYYSAADLFVGASLEETLGLTFIEAAACGTPTVGYSAGGVQEAIFDGVTGRLVGEKTPDALARMITELYQDTEQLQQLTHSAPIYIASHFSIRSTYQSLIVALGEVQWLEKLKINPICKFGVTPPQLKPSLCVKHLAKTDGIDEILVGENINGCILSGFGELESPYPELNLVSSSRWALWPSSQFAIESEAEKQGYLILAYRSVCVGQILEIWAEDQLMMQTLVKADQIKQENILTCPVTLQAGLNFFTLKMKQFTADVSSRKLGVLVEKIRFSPDLNSQKWGNGTVQGATKKVIAMDRTLTGTGWFPWETVNGVALRWMERVGSVMVDGMDVTQPLEVEVRGRTAIMPQVLEHLSLEVNGNPIPADVEAQADGSWRLLGRVQPGILTPQEAFVLSLHSAEVYPLSSQDCRSVSVLVEEIVVEAVRVKSSQEMKVLRGGQYGKAIKPDPNAEAYYNLGNELIKENQFDEAVNAYRKAIELEPQQFLYYHHLGDSFLLQQMYEEAVTPYRQAIEFNSEYAWSYQNLGKALSQLGRWEEAIAIYDEFLKLQPDAESVETQRTIIQQQLQEQQKTNVQPSEYSEGETTGDQKAMTKQPKIILFMPYYKAKHPERQEELIYCLQKNIQCDELEKIILMIDDNHTPEVESPKIEIIEISTRPTYLDWVELTEKRCGGQISILANTDIYFDESIARIREIFTTDPQGFVALSRYEKEEDNQTLHPNPHWSQDVWAVSGDYNFTKSFKNYLRVSLGVPRCDNKIAYLFAINGSHVYNPCHYIKTIHVQESQLRYYSKYGDTSILGGTAWVYPSILIDEPAKLQIDLWTLNTSDLTGIEINKTWDNLSKKTQPDPAPEQKNKKTENSEQKNDFKNVIAFDSDWQYPAITEKYAYEMANKLLTGNNYKKNVVYFGFPWATLIDKSLHSQDIAEVNTLMKTLLSFKSKLKKYKKVITVCQHIRMLEFESLFNEVGITDIFWSHTIKGQNVLPSSPNISLHPFPLYPVQAVDTKPTNLERKYLYSFIGTRGTKSYVTDLRNKIIDHLSDDKRGLIIEREQWHFNKIVYDHQILKRIKESDVLINQSATEEFKQVMQQSVFALCPSGSGPNSIRLWEAIGLGAIPVVSADIYLPPGDLKLWYEATVMCPETLEDIKVLPARLAEMQKDEELLRKKRHALQKIWMRYGLNCFIYDIVKLFSKYASGEGIVSVKTEVYKSLKQTAKTPATPLKKLKTKKIKKEDFKPSYVWPNPTFPFRLYYDSPQCRIFIIENIQHNWNWMAECHERFRKTDFFFVMTGWYHSPTFANEAETIFDVLNLDKTQFFFLYNSPLEMQNFAKKGFQGDVINQNAWIDQNVVIQPLKGEKIYNAIYVDFDKKYKRSQLASQVSRLALVTRGNPGQITSEIPSHEYMNHQQLSQKEICQTINQSYCGLILSAEEGACATVSEYLLSGIPIVSTSSVGGRDVWYNKHNSIVCEATPDSVASAVESFVKNPPDSQQIRQLYLEQVEEYRTRFIQVVADVFNRFGVTDVESASYFKKNFYNKMRKSENINFVKSLFV